jgi:ribonuclease-3
LGFELQPGRIVQCLMRLIRVRLQKMAEAESSNCPSGDLADHDGRMPDPNEVLPGYNIRPDLLRQALTHRSAENAGEDNERLEFLGDAVLELIVSEYLYRNHPEFSEGQLTKARVHGVSEPTLAEVAKRIGLGNHIIMSRGEEASGGRERPSILSDAFEAVVGAIYLDLGLSEARRFVLQHLEEAIANPEIRDYKSLLQEITQERLKVTPRYTIIHESGPAHNKLFVARVEINGIEAGQGVGKSKKEAEQSAARSALEGLKQWMQERI